MNKSILRNMQVIGIIILFSALVLFNVPDGYSQTTETSDIELTMELKTYKNSDDSRSLIAYLIGEDENGKIPVFEGTISFFNRNDNKEILLGTLKTDKTGKAVFNLPAQINLLKDKNGVIKFLARFEGTNDFGPSEAEISVKDLRLTMTLNEEDNLKTISVTANSIDATGNEIPLEECTVLFYIQGMFSRLNIGEGWLEGGECTFEFPKDLPGDEKGNLTIFAMIEEHEEYADVEKMEKAKWGSHRSNYEEPNRALWTSGAPFWMIITLTILLVGVWSHYLYAIVQIVKIGKEGKMSEDSNISI